MHQIATYFASAIERSARVLIIVLAVLLTLGIAVALQAAEPAFDVFPASAPPVSFDVFESGPPVSFDVFPDAEPTPKAKERRVVWVYHDKAYPCVRCKALKAAEKDLPEFEFKWAPIPKWVSDKHEGQPILHWYTLKGHDGLQLGWTNAKDFLENDRTYEPKEERPKSRSATTPVRHPGTTWTHPGDLRNHLMREHGINASSLQGLSYQQMRTVHDNLHNGHGDARSTSQQRASAACPSGRCPKQRAFQLMSLEENRSRPGAVRVARQLAIEFPRLTFAALLRIVLTVLLMVL